MSVFLVAPVEILLGLSFGLLFGLVLAVLVGSCSFAVSYTTDATLPGLALGSAAVLLAGTAGTTVGIIAPTTTQIPRLLVGTSVVFALALYASSHGHRLGADLPRTTAQPTVRNRTLAADAIDSIDAVGQVTIRSSGSVRGYEGYPPLGPTLRSAIEDDAWRFPADLPLSELETRLEDRLRTSHDLAAVAVSIDARGRATITAAPPTNGISKHVPAGWRAVSIPALLPTGLTSGDDVRIVTDTATVSGTVLGMSATADVSGVDTRESTTSGGPETVTVAVPTTATASLLETDRASLVVQPRGTSHEFAALSVLERGDESIRKVSITDPVREAIIDDATAVDAFAVRSPDSEITETAGPHAWTFEPADDALEIGSDAFLVGPDASEFGPETPLDHAQSVPNTGPVTEVSH